MPLYEYECEACGARFEQIRKFSDAPVEVCPTCGERKVQKLVSSPAIQFKGSGFYINDYARKGAAGTDATESSKDSKDAKDSKDSGKDSKDSKDSKDTKETKDTKDTKDSKETKSSSADSSSTSSSSPAPSKSGE